MARRADGVQRAGGWIASGRMARRADGVQRWLRPSGRAARRSGGQVASGRMASRADGRLGTRMAHSERKDGSASRRRAASGRMGSERKDGSASGRTGTSAIRFDGVPGCLPGGSLVSLGCLPNSRVTDHSVDRSTRARRRPDGSLVSLLQIVQRRVKYFARRVPYCLPDSPRDGSFGGSLDACPTARSTSSVRP
jgi:hypothetical protein